MVGCQILFILKNTCMKLGQNWNIHFVSSECIITSYNNMYALQSSERRDLSVRQATASRNEYLLSVAALNGHMKRFRDIDLTQILKV